MRIFKFKDCYSNIRGEEMAIFESNQGGAFIQIPYSHIQFQKHKYSKAGIVLESGRVEHRQRYSESVSVRYMDVDLFYSCYRRTTVPALLRNIDSIIFDKDFMRSFYCCGAISYKFSHKNDSVEVAVPTEIPTTYSNQILKNSVISWLRARQKKAAVRIYALKNNWCISLRSNELSLDKSSVLDVESYHTTDDSAHNAILLRDGYFLQVSPTNMEYLKNVGNAEMSKALRLLFTRDLVSLETMRNPLHRLYVDANNQIHLFDVLDLKRNSKRIKLVKAYETYNAIMNEALVKEIKTKVIKSGASLIPCLLDNKTAAIEIPVDFNLLPFEKDEICSVLTENFESLGSDVRVYCLDKKLEIHFEI